MERTPPKFAGLESADFHRAFMRHFCLNGPVKVEDVTRMTDLTKPEVFRKFVAMEYLYETIINVAGLSLAKAFKGMEDIRNGKNDQRARVAAVLQTVADNAECFEFLCLMSIPGAYKSRGSYRSHTFQPLHATAAEWLGRLSERIAAEVRGSTVLSPEDATAIFAITRVVAQSVIHGLEDARPMVDLLARVTTVGMSGLVKPATQAARLR